MVTNRATITYLSVQVKLERIDYSKNILPSLSLAWNSFCNSFKSSVCLVIYSSFIFSSSSTCPEKKCYYLILSKQKPVQSQPCRLQNCLWKFFKSTKDYTTSSITFIVSLRCVQYCFSNPLLFSHLLIQLFYKTMLYNEQDT